MDTNRNTQHNHYIVRYKGVEPCCLLSTLTLNLPPARSAPGAAWPLLKKMMDGMGVFQAIQSSQLPMPGSNLGYAPAQLLEQMMVSIWCGANRFVHSDITRLDKTLARLFGWSRVAEHKSIMRLFQRFDQSKATELQRNYFNWLFEKLNLNRIRPNGKSRMIVHFKTVLSCFTAFNPLIKA